MRELTFDVINDIIAKTKEQGGLTIKLETGEQVSQINSWFFPQYPSLTGIYRQDEYLPQRIESFITKNQSLFGTNNYLGLWVHPITHEFYLDICIDEKEKDVALQRAKNINEKSNRKIVAMYNPSLQETIFLD